jgi:tellurite methyltransferase
VTPDIGGRRRAEADDCCGDETEDANADGREKRLSHDAQNNTPSPFVEQWIEAVRPIVPAPRRAMDVAMGRGRHVLVLARNGFRTFGVDKSLEAVRDACMRASRENLTVRGWCADLTRSALPRHRFELAVVARYLQRDLFDGIRDALVPGGFVIYETFTTDQRALGAGPRSPDHLLERGELRERFADFEQLFYQEVVEREAVARLVARKP